VTEHQAISDEQLDQLEADIGERFGDKGWVMLGITSGHGEEAVGAEKLGTVAIREYASTPHALLRAIESRERQLHESNPGYDTSRPQVDTKPQRRK
jgi:hypothetical protein